MLLRTRTSFVTGLPDACFTLFPFKAVSAWFTALWAGCFAFAALLPLYHNIPLLTSNTCEYLFRSPFARSLSVASAKRTYKLRIFLSDLTKLLINHVSKTALLA
jgi:hypothetical protein